MRCRWDSCAGLIPPIVQSVKVEEGVSGRTSAFGGVELSTIPDQQARTDTWVGAMPAIAPRAAPVMRGQPSSGASQRL